MALVTTSQAAAAILASSASSTTTPVPSLVLPESEVAELESNELEQRIGEVVTDAAIEQLGHRWEEGENALQRQDEGDGVNWFATTVSCGDA